MEAISIGSDPRFYFQVGKMKISEGIKCLQDLVEWCKNNLSPENGGILHETMAYLQSLQRQIQEIECGAQQGGAAPASFNVHRTDLQRVQVIESLAPQGEPFVPNSCVNEQEIAQIRKQNTNFGSTLNQETATEKNKKRKTWSDVWNHFTKYDNEDKKVRAQCQYCKKDFDGSSKSGTTHLRNHLKNCLKNKNKIVDKMKEMSVVDQELNDPNLVRKLIKYQLNDIKDNIFEVYEQEENKLLGYLDQLPGRFNVKIAEFINNVEARYVVICFIDDNWKLKKRFIHLENYVSDKGGLNQNSLKHMMEDWNIDKRILSTFDYRGDLSKDMELNNWLNERASLPFIGSYDRCHHFLDEFFWQCFWRRNDILIEAEKLKDYYMTPSNRSKFESAVKNVESMGRKVTSEYNDVSCLCDFVLLHWAMGYKEVFCELENIDPDVKSINFDWDDATSLHGFWAVLEDMKIDIQKLDTKLANECFPIVYRSFLKMVQLENTENQYSGPAALCCREIFDKNCKKSELVLVITVILDPRFKLDIVQHFYKEIYDNEADLHFKKIIDVVTNIYNEYAKDVNNSSMVRVYAFPQHANEAASSKSELDRYLTDSKVSPHEGFDILEWWRFNSSTYPTLAMMARDFLSIPITSSAYDGDIICYEDDITNIYRTTGLDDDLKYALACTKVWLNHSDRM